jgi:hypothetical protein
MSLLTTAALVAVPAALSATVTGTAGPDRIAVQGNGARDQVKCGAGHDIVNADLDDRIARDCEVVSRRLSRDSTTAGDAQHETQVEPDSFAFGKAIVAVFQSGRYDDGGSAAIGWATSTDAGASWKRGFFATTTERASDPSVAYDAVHRVWLVSVLSITNTSLGVQVSRSTDALRWSTPATIVEGSFASGGYDKEWVACDNWPSSPFRGRCYLSYLNVAAEQLETRWSGDGGVTWSAPAITSVGVAANAEPNGAIPVPRPDGSLVVGFVVEPSRPGATTAYIAATRSTDGGATFAPTTRIADLNMDVDPVLGMRSPPLPSLDVDATGRVYMAWEDCRFTFECLVTDIVLASTADGVTWTAPARVPTRNLSDPTDEFIPGLAVEPASGRVAIAYYSLRQNGCVQDDCPGLNVNVIQSADRGATWGQPQRLNATPMQISWLADGGVGQMVGDYISTSFVGGRPVPVFSMASARDPLGTARQSIFAASRVAS